MFTELFAKEQWQDLMPGVRTCIFTEDRENMEIPVGLGQGIIEVVFCTEGSLVMKQNHGTELKLSAREILMMCSSGSLLSAVISGPFRGLCIRVDTAAAGDSFISLCHSFGDLPLSMHRVGEIMAATGGLRVMPVTPWSRSAFYTMKSIPQASWGHYCVLKTFELLYLMCTQNGGTESQGDTAGTSSYLNGIAENMRSYMESHLDEKLTILDLSRRFHLSRTACKSCFRACFGQPIHSWILDRRMEQATDLLEHTNMPVLQIAQSVGYSGVSQFNAAFKQRYGKTPREYRKMSISGCC